MMTTTTSDQQQQQQLEDVLLSILWMAFFGRGLRPVALRMRITTVAQDGHRIYAGQMRASNIG
jgi:hypothetical protein